MAIRIVRLGSPRKPTEGPRLGTVRRPPRGVPKAQYARRDYYDAWLPELAPSAKLLAWGSSAPWTDPRWARFERDYRREMSEPACARLLEVLARLSHQAHFSVGCYCEHANRCHRSILRDLLLAHGAEIVPSE